MYNITEAEQAAFGLVQALSEQTQETREELRGLRSPGFGADDEQWAASQAQADKIRERLEAAEAAEATAQEAPEFLLYVLKTMANKALADKLPLPGGSPVALLTLAEETIESLDSGNGQRMTGLLRNIFLRVFKAIADPEINEARAVATAARYKALIYAGIPETLAGQILVAEASRPWPAVISTSSKR